LFSEDSSEYADEFLVAIRQILLQFLDIQQEFFHLGNSFVTPLHKALYVFMLTVFLPTRSWLMSLIILLRLDPTLDDLNGEFWPWWCVCHLENLMK
jgi:hypothetical protein